MALLFPKKVADLASPFVLAPERYDPRREGLRVDALDESSVTLGSIVLIVRETANPLTSAAGERRCLVFDTSDVREGFVIGRKEPIRLVDVGSTKKLFRQNDVLISRLRPYLRQVAFVDTEVGSGFDGELACSTEFFVLRSLTEEPIGFVVPYLLSDPVQGVLAASQEGGHHPRFDEDALMRLPIPESLVARRAEVSTAVARSAVSYRQSERTICALVRECGALMTTDGPIVEKRSSRRKT